MPFNVKHVLVYMFLSNVFWLFTFYLIITDTSLIFFSPGHTTEQQRLNG